MKSQCTLVIMIAALFCQTSAAQTEVTWRNNNPLPEALTPAAIREMAFNWGRKRCQDNFLDIVVGAGSMMAWHDHRASRHRAWRITC